MRALVNILLAVFAALGASSCGGDRIEIVIEPEGGCDGACGRAPLGCAESLSLGQIGERGLLAMALGVVGPSDANQNLCVNDFSSALVPEIEEGATELEIWGFAPAPGDVVGPLSPAPLFVARGGFDRDRGRAHLEARCALSCEGMHPWSHEKWVQDLVSGVAPPGVEALGVTAGMVFDLRSFYPEQPEPDVRAAGFAVVADGPRAEDGGVVLAGEVIDWPFEAAHRCWAVYLASDQAGRQVICADPEEPVVHYLDPGRREVVQGWLEQRDPGQPPGDGYFVGLIRNAANNEPLDGATVAAPPQVRVLYPDFAEEWSPDAAVRPESGPHGVFVVRGPCVGEIAVEKAGFEPVSLRVAALPGFVGSRVIHLLPTE